MSDSFLLTLKGFNLVPTTRGWLGGSRTNPAYKLSAFQMGQAEPFYVVYESETIEDDLNPNWHRSSTSASFFGEPDMPVMITVVDKQPDKENLIGSVETSLRDIQRRAVGNTEQVDASKVFKLKDARGRDAGMLIVKEARMGSADESEEEPEPEPEATPVPPETPPRSTTSLGSTTPNSNTTMNGHANNSNNSTPARDSITGSSSLLEVAKLNQMIKDMTKRQDKLESETKDLKDENQQLKDRVKYLENSLKQDRRIMEMAQSEIRQLKDTQTQLKEEIKTAKTQAPQANGYSTPPKLHNPGFLDEDLIITASADIDEDERSAKRETSHRHRRDKKDSSQKSSSTLSTLDSDEKSNKSSKSGDGDRRHYHRSHRQASSSTIGSRSSEKPRSDKSMRKSRSMDGSKDGTPLRSSKPASSSSSKPSSSRSSPSDRPRSTRDRSEKGRSARR